MITNKVRSEISRVTDTFRHRRDSSHTNEALGKHNLDAVRRVPVSTWKPASTATVGIDYWLSHTLCRSTTSIGELGGYKWGQPPDLNAIDGGDDSGRTIADIIRRRQRSDSHHDSRLRGPLLLIPRVVSSRCRPDVPARRATGSRVRERCQPDRPV